MPTKPYLDVDEIIFDLEAGRYLDHPADDPNELEFDNACPVCRGTGIGQHGDINTSKCVPCHGTGVRRDDDADQGAAIDEAHERMRDARDERERERGTL
jgi:hypothetical protein